MKKIINLYRIFVAIIINLILVSCNDPEFDETADLRILAIGNSFAEDAVNQNLYELFEASGKRVVIGCLSYGACSLEQHCEFAARNSKDYSYYKIVKGKKHTHNNSRIKDVLKSDDWDVVTLQQVSNLSGEYATFLPYVQELCDLIKETTNAHIMFHQTWAYAKNADHSGYDLYNRNQLQMYKAINEATIKVIKEHYLIEDIIPAGTAIQNGRTSYLGDTFNRDGIHLEESYGRYTVACTWFEKISGEKVIGNPYRPRNIDSKMQHTAQRSAHAAILEPHGITEIPDENE